MGRSEPLEKRGKRSVVHKQRGVNKGDSAGKLVCV